MYTKKMPTHQKKVLTTTTRTVSFDSKNAACGFQSRDATYDPIQLWRFSIQHLKTLLFITIKHATWTLRFPCKYWAILSWWKALKSVTFIAIASSMRYLYGQWKCAFFLVIQQIIWFVVQWENRNSLVVHSDTRLSYRTLGCITSIQIRDWISWASVRNIYVRTYVATGCKYLAIGFMY